MVKDGPVSLGWNATSAFPQHAREHEHAEHEDHEGERDHAEHEDHESKQEGRRGDAVRTIACTD